MLSVRKLTDLKEVLLNPVASGPEDVYYMLRGQPNFTITVPGKIGQEYSKTFGHYHQHNEPERYEVLLGEAIFILQSRQNEIKTVHAKKGDIVEIPAGWGHNLSNTGETLLITADNAPGNAETEVNDYEPIRQKHGMAYYVIEENGQPKLIRNKNYE